MHKCRHGNVHMWLDEWEDMCIVALEPDVSVKMDHQVVQDLLLSAGFTPPNEQVGVVNGVGVI